MRRSLGALLLAFALSFAACGGGERPELIQSAPPTTTTTEATTTTTEPKSESVQVAESINPTIDIYAGPLDPAPARTLDVADEISGKLVFLVKQDAGGRLEVYLPVRPNGSTGWVNEDAVKVTRNPYRIEVALAAHTLKVFDNGEVIMDTQIAVGTQDTPTPGGIFYLKELLRPPNPNGVYGSYAYGLSGFSNVLESFAGGNGVIGIHGTNDPSKIGTDVSHGCIRLTNEDIERLVEEVGLPLGTPVQIKA